MLYKYILLFFIYSFIGWMLEIILTLFSEKKLVNRGFLMGPYLPIYGFGCVFLTLLLDSFKDNLIILFIITFITCSLLEYLTSYMLEKVYNLRWWDYKQFKYNINGRICLETMLPFSIGGVLAIKYANPFFISIIDTLPLKLVLIFEIILVTIIIIDFLISSLLTKKINVDSTNNDDTETIKKELKKDVKTYVKKTVSKSKKKR